MALQFKTVNCRYQVVLEIEISTKYYKHLPSYFLLKICSIRFSSLHNSNYHPYKQCRAGNSKKFLQLFSPYYEFLFCQFVENKKFRYIYILLLHSVYQIGTTFIPAYFPRKRSYEQTLSKSLTWKLCMRQLIPFLPSILANLVTFFYYGR